MLIWVPTLFLALSIVSTAAMAIAVVAQNRSRWSHRAFAAMCLNLGLWAVGVLLIIHSDSEAAAKLWLSVTFAIASFLPATFYTFIGFFPRARFEGSRLLCGLFWAYAAGLAAGAFTPWHVGRVELRAGEPPFAEYGPVFDGFGLSIALVFIGALINLVGKLRASTGLERRQVQHLLLSIFFSMTLAIVTNVVAPLIGVGTMQPYGPAFTTVMMAWFAYAMVRYHLLDTMLIISRTTVYLVMTAVVAAVFMLSVSLLHWQSLTGPSDVSVLMSLITALVVVVLLQPMREWMQRHLDRLLLHRRYDLSALMARISRAASETVNLAPMLKSIAEDIAETVGARPVRLLLATGTPAQALTVAFATDRGGADVYEGPLLEYIRRHDGGLVLERLIHEGARGAMGSVVNELSELDAHMCIPLKSKSGVVGMLTLGRKTSKDIYTQDDLLAFTTAAGPLATAIENARLYRQLELANMHRAQILRSMRGGVITADEYGKITLANRSAEELCGAIEIGQGIDQLPSSLAEALREALGSRRSVDDFEAQFPGEDGPIHCAISATALRDAEGRITGAMVMLYDLTQLKRLEENVERADRLSSIGTLAAGMAHEIKNPLVSIKTFTQLLPKRHMDMSFIETFADVVPHEVDRIDSIVTRLLDFARPRPLTYTEADVRDVLHKVIALTENQIHKADIRLDAVVPEEPLMVYGDDQQLLQVFLNLILNAIESIPPERDGQIRIYAGLDYMQTRRDSTLQSSRSIECVRVSVEDNGHGVPSDLMPHLFTPFYTTKEHGSGLGLSVVHGIVSEHGGEIYVTSQESAGANFSVTLPLSRRAAVAAEG